jgi:hypothetical protein
MERVGEEARNWVRVVRWWDGDEDLYGNHERDDLTPDEKKERKQLAERLQAEAIRMARGKKKDSK